MSADSATLPQLAADFQCALAQPLLGRCAREGGRTEDHHLVPRSSGGTEGQQAAVCHFHHDQIHPGPDFSVVLKRVILTKARGGFEWKMDPTGEPVELRDRVAETLNRSYPEPEPGVYGYLQAGSLLDVDPETESFHCPACSRKVAKAKAEQPCGFCGFNYDGWIWLIWPNIERQWEQRAIAGDEGVDELLVAEQNLGWKMADVLDDMRVGRLWQLHDCGSLDEYAASKGKRGVTFRQYLKAAARVRSLPADLQEPTKQLPIHVLVAKGVKFEQLTAEQIITLAKIRRDGSPVEALKAAIDEMVPDLIEMKSRTKKKPVEVECFASAVSFRVRVNVAPGEDAVEVAQKRVARMAYVDGVQWKRKGHQVKRIRA